jgi:uncharacterized protein involved in outer membrane biogenesis
MLRRLFIGLIGFVLVLIVLPWCIPTAAYLQQAESIAQAQFQQKVTIGSMQLAILPTPRVKLTSIVVGDALVSADTITVIPEFWPLLQGEYIIQQLVITSPVVKHEAIAMIQALTQSNSAVNPSSTVDIKKVILRSLVYEHARMTSPVLDLDIDLNHHVPQHVVVLSEDHHLKAELHQIHSKAFDYDITIEAQAWRLPKPYALKLDRLNVKATWVNQRLDIKSLEAEAYSGVIKASGTLAFTKAWQLNGQLDISHLAVAPALAAFQQANKLSGFLMMQGHFQAKARTLDTLFAQLRAQFSLEIKKGTLHGIDLIKAASLLTKTNQQGNTQFDRFTSQLRVAGNQYEFKKLDIRSGLMRAHGDVKLSPNDRLDGVIKVELKNSASLVAIPLQVSGTLASPKVFPTKAAIAGAVLGTAVLGPGTGTSIGATVGEQLDNFKRGLLGDD